MVPGREQFCSAAGTREGMERLEGKPERDGGELWSLSLHLEAGDRLGGESPAAGGRASLESLEWKTRRRMELPSLELQP